jgi:hypothetical protein
MYLLFTSSGLNVGHQMFCDTLVMSSATALGRTGAREGGFRVTDATRSSRYSYVTVDGPGRLSVRENCGCDSRFTRAWATSKT